MYAVSLPRMTAANNSAPFTAETLHMLDPRKLELLEAKLNPHGAAVSNTFAFAGEPIIETSQQSQHSEISQPSDQNETPDKSRGGYQSETSHRKRRRRDTTAEPKQPPNPKIEPRKITDYMRSYSQPGQPLSPQHLSGTYASPPHCSPQHSNSNSNGCSETKTQLVQTDMDLSEVAALETSATRVTEAEERDKLATKQENRVLQDGLKKALDHIKELLIEKSEVERKQCRRQTAENSYRIGQLTARRIGLQTLESWVDGTAYVDLERRRQLNREQREELEEMRKSLLKRKPIPPNSPRQARDASLSQADYYEAEEIIKLKMAALRKEEGEYNLEFDKLEREKVLQSRRQKRQDAEDASQYKNFPILNQRYLLLNLLGKGGFSEVHKAFDLKELRYVAVKVHQLDKTWKDDRKNNYIRHACRELDIHKTLKHNRIVALFDYFDVDSNSFCTVMDYSDGNDLDIYLKQMKMLSEKEARSIIMQLVAALKYLNERNPPVIHYDLKPGNILMGCGVHSGEIQVTDFGLSKIMEPDHVDEAGLELTSQGAGTYWYLPPECFAHAGGPPRISSKVDTWSVGVIFYQCLYGKKPFGDGMAQREVESNQVIINAREVTFPARPTVTSEAKAFIRRCLAYHQDDRPGVLQLAEDEYLKPRQRQQTSGESMFTSPLPPVS